MGSLAMPLLSPVPNPMEDSYGERTLYLSIQTSQLQRSCSRRALFHERRTYKPGCIQGFRYLAPIMLVLFRGRNFIPFGRIKPRPLATHPALLGEISHPFHDRPKSSHKREYMASSVCMSVHTYVHLHTDHSTILAIGALSPVRSNHIFSRHDGIGLLPRSLELRIY